MAHEEVKPLSQVECAREPLGAFWHEHLSFLAQDPFITFVPLPGPPPTTSNF